MKKIFGLIMMVLSLVACKEAPTSGYVVGKEFVPAHTTKRFNVVLKMVQVKHHPDKWVVWVADSCCVHSVQVDVTTFDRLKHGQFIRFNDGKWQSE